MACHKVLVCRGTTAIEYELKLRTRRILEMNPADMTGATLADSCNRRFTRVCLQPRDQRERLVSQRTGIINQIRAFLLERGIAVRQGQRFLRAELPRILATPPDVLSPRMVRMIENLAGDWRRLDERVEGLSNEIEAIARQDAGCERLMSVPGIGPMISSAMVAAIGAGDVFTKGRDFAAWLGLVPKQVSTGDRTILGKISRRGNRYLRVLFVQAAWVVLIKPKVWERHGLKPWIEAARKRLHHHVLAIALANKLARIAWSVLARGRAFEARKMGQAVNHFA